MLEIVIILFEYNFYSSAIQGLFPLSFLHPFDIFSRKISLNPPIGQMPKYKLPFTKGEKALCKGISSYLWRFPKVFHKVIVKFWMPTPSIFWIKYKQIKINLTVCLIHRSYKYIELIFMSITGVSGKLPKINSGAFLLKLLMALSLKLFLQKSSIVGV